MTIWKSGWPHFLPSLCPRLPWKATPTVRRIHPSQPIAPGSRANMSTASSRAASDTICRKKLPKHLPRQSSMWITFDRLWLVSTLRTAYTVRRVNGKARQRSHTVLAIIMGALLPIVVILLLGFFSGWHKDFTGDQATILNRMVTLYALPLLLFGSTVSISRS